MAFAILLIIIGFVLLTLSADYLVENASVLAANLGISTFIVGVVVIGFGTSAPELFVSAMAAMENKGNLALGNALGSNITNIGLVLGCAAAICTLTVSKGITRKEIPLVIAAGVAAIAVLLDGVLSRLDGVFLFALLIGFLAWSILNSKQSGPQEKQTCEQGRSTSKALLLTVASIVVLIFASKILVKGAIIVASALGISDLVIGLTVIAIGTSLPELAAAISAARKGSHDMIVGNIIGSNIFNTLGVLGLTGMIRATTVDASILLRDFPVMFAFTVLMWWFAYSKLRFGRSEGIILLLGYLAYICYLTITAIS